jgi:chemosensory pili system protein ChpC
METGDKIIRCLLLPTSAGAFLLPNATVAEIISYTPPAPIDETPDWLLGQISWRGWRLPLLSMSLLTGLGEGASAATAKVAILKSPGRHPRMPFIGVRIQGFPRLTNVTSDELEALDDDSVHGEAVAGWVRVRADEGIIPDLNAMESMIIRLGESREDEQEADLV